MTKPEAIEWAHAHQDDDPMDEDDLEAVFEALYERAPDYQDRKDGLWSLVCLAVEGW